MKTLKVYEISQQMRELFDSVDPETGEISQDSIQQLNQLMDASTQSITDLACYVVELQLESETILEIVKTSADRARKLADRAEHYRGLILSTMELTGTSKISDPRISVRIQNNPPSVEVFAQDEIPDLYLRVIPEKKEPDRSKIREALKKGEMVEGCCLTTTRRIVIK